MITAAIPIICSLAYAYRGRSSLGTQFGRLVWSITVGFSVFFATSDWYTPVICFIGAYVGMFLSHGHYFTVGNNKNPVNKNDWLKYLTIKIPKLKITNFKINFYFQTFLKVKILPDDHYLRDVLAMIIIGNIRAILILWPTSLWYLAPVVGIIHWISYDVAFVFKDRGAIELAEYIYGALFGGILMLLYI